jgi:hypothetical protein
LSAVAADVGTTVEHHKPRTPLMRLGQINRQIDSRYLKFHDDWDIRK